jgi:type I restriction enzyme M protein
MPNERRTEEFVRTHLKKHASPGQLLEEQTSDDPKIRRALAKASKSGDGVGKPEFVLRLKDHPDLVIVVECKADATKHVSKHLDKPALYAVDGVLVYSTHLSKDFDVISIAVSGTDTASLRVSTFRQLRGSPAAEPLKDEHGLVSRLVPVVEYRRLLDFDPAMRRRTQDELMAFSGKLNNYFRDVAKLSESERPLAVSGCLLALRDDAFKVSWRKYKSNTLSRELLAAVSREIEAAVPERNKQKAMLHPYQFIETHPVLNSVPQNQPDWPLRSVIEMTEEHVRPFLDVYRDIDVIGQFYGEFLRYVAGDQQGLGIVLTPRHLTELFVKIARVGLNDTIVDTCCGTGGFLIAALAELDSKAGGDKKIREDIRKHRLVGVEQQPHMFALAASNMILRGDGKANLFQGSCFDPDIAQRLTHPDAKRYKRPTVGLINPPFSQKGAGLHEWDFVAGLLDVLTPSGGRAVVVLPMSCAIEPHPMRAKILAKHTLVAAMSLPNDLFHPVGVIPCAMVFEAHRPHADAQTATWFASWKDDGFVKQKQKGRIDLRGAWSAIRDTWLEAFHARGVVPGQSLLQKVTADDEWCAEAYLEPDYASLNRGDFETLVREYAMFDAIYAAEADAS